MLSMTTTRFTFTKTELRALLQFCMSKKQAKTRAALACVLFEPRFGRVVATDGHTLAILTRKANESDAEQFMIEGERLALVLKEKGSDLVGVDRGETSWLRLGGVEGGRMIRPIDLYRGDMTFPPYRQVVPDPTVKSPKNEAVGIHGLYFSRLGLIAESLETGDPKHPGSRAGLKLHPPSGELDPILFEADSFKTGSSWQVVIMPQRL